MIDTLLSRPCSYAVRALTYLAMQPAGELTGKEEIARNECIPSAFLGKVLLFLCRDHVLRSRKGLRGGYVLAVPAEQIPLLTIVRSVEGEPFKQCLLEDRECSSSHPCDLHGSWCVVRDQLLNYLEEITVADLVELRRDRQGKSARSTPAGSCGPARREPRGE